MPNKLEIPIIGTGDTNVDPDELDYIIPANDDAIRAIRLLCQLVADAAIEGQRERAARAVRAEPEAEAAEPEPEFDEIAVGRARRGPRRRAAAHVRAGPRRRGPAARRTPRSPPSRVARSEATPDEIAAELAREAAETAEAAGRRRRPRADAARRRAHRPETDGGPRRHGRTTNRSTTTMARSRPTPSRSCASGPARG